MIEQWLACLSKAGCDLTTIEAAEALWLAQFMLPLETEQLPKESGELLPLGGELRQLPESPVVAQPAPSPGIKPEPNIEKPSAPNSPFDQPDGEHVYSGAQPGSNATSLQAPAAAALPQKLDIARAFRPIFRSIASRMYQELDEEKTVHDSAEVGFLQPTLRPQTEPWMEIVLIIDQWHSMSIWKETIDEFVTLLEQTGKFRKVTVAGLKLDQTGSLSLCAAEGHCHRMRWNLNPGVGVNYEWVILLASDCMNPSWRDGKMGSWLKQWGNVNIALLQVLPEEFWDATGLDQARLVITRTPMNRGQFSPRYKFSEFDDDLSKDDFLLPVIDFEPPVIHNWAQALSGNANYNIPAYLISDAPGKPKTNSQVPLTAQERYEQFMSTASEVAQDLAVYLSAVPLYLPVIRAVQQALLPDSGLHHLAEVLLGGLMVPISDRKISLLQGVEYEFHKGVRELLQDNLLAGEAITIEQKIGELLEHRWGIGKWFAVAVRGEEDTSIQIVHEERPFAIIATQVLRRYGTRFEDRIRKLENFSQSNQPYLFQTLNAETPDAIVTQARQRYLTHLRKFCQSLPLAALGADEGSELGVGLDDVYIDLDTTAFIEEDQSASSYLRVKKSSSAKSTKTPLSILQTARKNPRMVLLGDPGSGKSTFVRKLVGWLAGAALDGGVPPEGFPAGGLPLLINLRDLAPRLAGLNLDELSAQKQQEELIAAFTAQLEAELKIAQAEGLQADLMQGLSRNGLLVLDGLDEIPLNLRALARKMVFAILHTFAPFRVIITCRIRSYQDDFSRLDFGVFTVAPLDKDKITGFAQAWYHRQRDLGRTVPQNAEDDLARAATGPDLQELASNPMMLTTIAIIHQKQTRLPDQRVKLYKEAVDILLRHWQQHKQGELSPSEALAQFLKEDTRLRPAMYRLAHTVHCAGCKNGGVADLPRGEALVILADKKYLGDLNLAQEFLDYVDQRAGLLVGRGGEGEEGKPVTYGFPHRTFQEYLAGCHIAGLRDYRAIVQELWERAAEGVDWSLATRLAVEELYHNREDPYRVLDITYWLREIGGMQDAQHQRAWLWSAQQTLLVGRTKIEADPPGQKHLDQIIPALVNLLGGSLTPIERVEAGNILAHLGDPRPEVLTCEAMAFCEVPAGAFICGGDKDQKKLTLPGFWIGKYPVTVAQFDQFVQAGGYTHPDYWAEAIEEKYWTQSGFKESYDDVSRTAPVDYGLPFSLPNHPVVGVSWYEAMAYTRWLNQYLLRCAAGRSGSPWPELAAGKLKVALPTHEQWEKSARGIDGRTYPWGADPDSDRANTTESGIGTTSAVSCFPRGASPYGALDMSGNVWEWVLTDPFDLRGGSWNYSLRLARCASRYWFDPDNWHDSRGFRICLSPL